MNKEQEEKTYDAAGGVSTPASPGAKNSKEELKGTPKIILYCGSCSIGYLPSLTPLEDNNCLECKKEMKEIGWIEYA